MSRDTGTFSFGSTLGNQTFVLGTAYLPTWCDIQVVDSNAESNGSASSTSQSVSWKFNDGTNLDSGASNGTVIFLPSNSTGGVALAAQFVSLTKPGSTSRVTLNLTAYTAGKTVRITFGD